MGKHFDAATGTAKPIGEWASAQWNDLVNWGSGICGKHNNQGSCDGAATCDWCANDNKCYMIESPDSPCSLVQKGKEALTKEFNDLLGSSTDCAKEKVDAHATLKDAQKMAADNLMFACSEYVKTEFYAQRSLAALGEDLGNAADEVNEMAGVQVAQAQQALFETVNSMNAS